MDQHPATAEVTRLLSRLSGGDAAAMTELTPLVYEELRRLAHMALRHRAPAETLHTTALVHEAYMKLVDQDAVEWEGRSHFFGVAARAMRSIMVDHVRQRMRLKRGGGRQRVPLDEAIAVLEQSGIDLLDLDAALTRLAENHERKSRVVELRYFAGLEIEETAAALGVSHATVERDWDYAKAWLFRELKGGATG